MKVVGEHVGEVAQEARWVAAMEVETEKKKRTTAGESSIAGRWAETGRMGRGVCGRVAVTELDFSSGRVW